MTGVTVHVVNAELDGGPIVSQAAVPVQDKGLPTPVSGSGALAGVYFVGYDVRQPGGVLHTIGQQAMQVTAQIAASRAASEAAPDGVRVAT